MEGGRTSSPGLLGRAGHAVADLVASPYAGLVRLRRWAYRKGLLGSKAAGVPVICVGNLSTGGTGKTPMVAWVVRRLQEKGRTPAILTRGYKAREGLSDEAELLKAMTGAAVVVEPDRVAGAARAIEAGADVCVMDDGFQHLRLRRDLNIVLIDATRPVDTLHCPPCGLLREGLWALADAGAVVLTRCDLTGPGELAALERQLDKAAPGASVHRAVHEPVGLIGPDGSRRPAGQLAGVPVLAFCGLGNPAGFFGTLERLGAHLVARECFGDHAAYDAADLAALSRKARAAGAQRLVTTEKDYVKLAGLACELPVDRLAVEMRIVTGEDELTRKIEAAVSR